MNPPSIVSHVREHGYLFIDGFFSDSTVAELEQEAGQLPFEAGDHVTHPINKGKPNEVRQFHERFYVTLDDPTTPVASRLCHQLAQQFSLPGWLPDEIGYQRYRDSKDWISPHRDRRSDRLLSVTLTLSGSAWVHIYRPDTDPPDYTKITRIDSFLTKRGTAMFLRAPGLGSGDQIIHEVDPPVEAPRLILNLRMRATVLKNPADTKYE